MQKYGILKSLLLVFTCHLAFGQLVEQPLPFVTNAAFRTTEALDTLRLPFWDDFSTGQGLPNQKLWQGTDAQVSFTHGVRPPSIGVLVFDGARDTGAPHNPNTQFVGPSDSLLSMPINLASIPDGRKSSVWLSFFWQIRGLGEIPELTDSLKLQFFTSSGTWRTVWSITGGSDNLKNEFEQVLLPLDRQEYFHAGFRFKFQAFTRLTGPFDSFLIDYVYLNEGRSVGNRFYFDRALTTIPSYVLDGYSAIPIKQFATAAASYVKAPEVTFFNLDNQLQPVDYSVLVKNRVTGQLIDALNQSTVVNPVPQGLERRTITANAPNVGSWPLNSDSLLLETMFYISSGDLVRDGIDFRVNDTVRTEFTLHDYFAYDDGTAEFAAGINQNRGQLVVKYAVAKPAFLTHVDIHFPQIFPISSSQPLEILVMSELSTRVGSLLAKQPGIVQYSDSPNGFISYRLEVPVQVSDTFYVGFSQFTDNFIGVGLDKNNDTGRKIYANVLGFWEQNTRVEGSLMIRPKFAEIETVTSAKKPQKHSLLFPNPTTGEIMINGPLPDEVAVMDMTGRVLMQEKSRNVQRIDIGHLPKGIYIIRLVSGGHVETHKVKLE